MALGDRQRPLEGDQCVLKRKQDWSWSWCRLKEGDLGPAKAFRGTVASWLSFNKIQAGHGFIDRGRWKREWRDKKREMESTLLSHTHTYILVAHVPVGSLSIGHDLPHDDAEAPDIWGRGEAVVLDGLRSGPQHHTLASVLRERSGEVRRGVKRVWRVHKTNALIFSLKSFEHIFGRSKESLEEWVHLHWNPKISKEVKRRNVFFPRQLNYVTSAEPHMTCVNSPLVQGSLKISPLHAWTSFQQALWRFEGH